MKTELSKRIKAKRQSLNLRPEDLASKTGLSFSTIVKIERGESRPDTDTLQYIASALGVTVASLLEEEKKSA